MRWIGVVWLVLIAVSAFGLYQLKYQVIEQERTLAEIRRDIRDQHDAIHVLRAEWAHQTSPARLRALNTAHMHLQPIVTAQIHEYEAVPVPAPEAPQVAVTNYEDMEQLLKAEMASSITVANATVKGAR